MFRQDSHWSIFMVSMQTLSALTTHYSHILPFYLLPGLQITSIKLSSHLTWPTPSLHVLTHMLRFNSSYWLKPPNTREMFRIHKRGRQGDNRVNRMGIGICGRLVDVYSLKWGIGLYVCHWLQLTHDDGSPEVFHLSRSIIWVDHLCLTALWLKMNAR